MSRGRVRLATVAALVLLLAVAALRLELTHSITHFLPRGGAGEGLGLGVELVDSSLSRRMVLSVGGGEGRHAAAAALADELVDDPEVAWVEGGLDEEAQRELFGLYFPRRFLMASDRPATGVPALFRPAALADRAAALRRELAGPAAPLVARTAPEDPLGLFASILARVVDAEASLGVEQGVFTARDGQAIVFLATRASPFDAERQGPFLERLDAAFARLDARHGGDLVLQTGGVHRIALASERSIRGDVDFISVVSVLGVCTLFVLVFGSPSKLLLALLPAFAGLVTALALASLGSAPLHGVTLGFGLALIGVSIDYPIHVLNHQALLDPGQAAGASVRRLRSTLLLSGLTTAASFAILGASDFPGLGAMGGFAAAGLLAALAATLLALPAFAPAAGAARPSAFQRAASARLAAGVAALARRPRLALLPPLLLAGLALAGLPRLAWQDDPGALNAADPGLVAEDAAVRARVLDAEAERVVVALAADPEGALALNDRVALALAAAEADGHLEGSRSAHAFLWSRSLQAENLAAFRAVSDPAGKVDRAFSEAGFRPGAFAAFGSALASAESAPLTPEELAGSPLARVLDALLVDVDGRTAALSQLRGVRSADGVRAAIADLPGVHYVDRPALLRALFAGYRRSTVSLVAVGALLVGAVLWLRYRRARTALLALLPSAGVACATLGVLGLLGVAVNVVVAISLVIVMGMGVDYGVFAVDGARSPERVGPTLLSLATSCVTTLFVFGVLALSGQPALRAIGLTTGIGILLALASAPAVLVLATAERDAPVMLRP